MITFWTRWVNIARQYYAPRELWWLEQLHPNSVHKWFCFSQEGSIRRSLWNDCPLPVLWTKSKECCLTVTCLKSISGLGSPGLGRPMKRSTSGPPPDYKYMIRCSSLKGQWNFGLHEWKHRVQIMEVTVPLLDWLEALCLILENAKGT